MEKKIENEMETAIYRVMYGVIGVIVKTPNIPLVTSIILSYLIPYIRPPVRSLDYSSSNKPCRNKEQGRARLPCWYRCRRNSI